MAEYEIAFLGNYTKDTIVSAAGTRLVDGGAFNSAGAFTPAQVKEMQATAFVLGPSFRGEVGLDVIQALAAKGASIAVDIQGWVRVIRDGKLAYEA
jgi:hypothetical protein